MLHVFDQMGTGCVGADDRSSRGSSRYCTCTVPWCGGANQRALFGRTRSTGSRAAGSARRARRTHLLPRLTSVEKQHATSQFLSSPSQSYYSTKMGLTGCIRSPGRGMLCGHSGLAKITVSPSQAACYGSPRRALGFASQPEALHNRTVALLGWHSGPSGRPCTVPY